MSQIRLPTHPCTVVTYGLSESEARDVELHALQNPTRPPPAFINIGDYGYLSRMELTTPTRCPGLLFLGRVGNATEVKAAEEAMRKAGTDIHFIFLPEEIGGGNSLSTTNNFLRSLHPRNLLFSSCVLDLRPNGTDLIKVLLSLGYSR